MDRVTEIAGLDNDVPTQMQWWTLPDWTLSDRFGKAGHCSTGQWRTTYGLA